MSTTRVALTALAPQRFEARDEVGHTLLLAGSGAELAEGESALRPMHLLLAALGGCAALGIQRILDKQRQAVSELRVELEGDREAEPPTTFTAIRLHIIVRGQGLDRARVMQAVQLTEERYCSVYALLRRAVPIETTVALEEG